MARIRTIKPEYWSNEKVMSCTRNSRLLFIGIWNFADDAGRCPDSAKTFKAQIFPGDDDVNSEMVRGMLDELSGNGLLLKYEVDGRAYVQVIGWNHQRIDKPQPPKCPPQDSTNGRGALATDLILSYPTISKLKSDETSSARSLASARPSGALAREPDAGSTERPKETLRGKLPCELSRAELEAVFAAKPKG